MRTFIEDHWKVIIATLVVAGIAVLSIIIKPKC